MTSIQTPIGDFIGSKAFPESYQKMISRPVTVSDLLKLFPFHSEAQVIALAATNRLPKDPDADGNWRHDASGSPIFHPAAAHIVLNMSLLKDWLDRCDASYSVEDLAALSIKEILDDLEWMERCMKFMGEWPPKTPDKIRILKSLNGKLCDEQLLDYISIFEVDLEWFEEETAC